MIKILYSLIFIILATVATYFIFDYIQEPQSLTKSVQYNAGGKYIQLSKGKVHYEFSGEKKNPLIVLIGGGGLGYNIWDKNLDGLIKSGYRVLRYDHYGRGYSDKVNEKYSLDLFYNEFVELIQALKVEEPFDLAGVSMGAMIAIKFTLNVPSSVRKLILIDPAGIYPFKAPIVLKTPIISDLLMTFYWRPKAVKSQLQEFYNPSKFPEYKNELEKQITLKGYKKVQHSIWLNTLNVDMSTEIKSLADSGKEILLIWGKQDPRTLFETSDFFLNAIPKIQFVPVDQAGHLSNYERPDIVNPAMIRFLKS